MQHPAEAVQHQQLPAAHGVSGRAEGDNCATAVTQDSEVVAIGSIVSSMACLGVEVEVEVKGAVEGAVEGEVEGRVPGLRQ